MAKWALAFLLVALLAMAFFKMKGAGQSKSEAEMAAGKAALSERQLVERDADSGALRMQVETIKLSRKTSEMPPPAGADSLKKRISMVFQRADIIDVLETVSAQINAPVYADLCACDQIGHSGLRGNTEITLRFENVQAAAALKMIARQAGLRYAIENKMIVLTTKSPPLNAAPDEIDPEAKAQNDAMRKKLSKKITLQLAGADVRDAIAMIAIETAADAINEPRVSQRAKNISVKAEDEEAASVLERVLKQAQMHYAIVDGIVFVELDTAADKRPAEDPPLQPKKPPTAPPDEKF